MTKKKTSPKKQLVYHKNGSIWAKGQKLGEVCVGYWEWFRLDGTKMRSGHFDQHGEQVGDWTTYDKKGQVVKVTTFTAKRKPET